MIFYAFCLNCVSSSRIYLVNGVTVEFIHNKLWTFALKGISYYSAEFRRLNILKCVKMNWKFLIASMCLLIRIKFYFYYKHHFAKNVFIFSKQSISIQNKINKAIGIKSLEIKGTTPIHSFRHVVLVYILSFTLILGAIWNSLDFTTHLNFNSKFIIDSKITTTTKQILI